MNTATKISRLVGYVLAMPIILLFGLLAFVVMIILAVVLSVALTVMCYKCL